MRINSIVLFSLVLPFTACLDESPALDDNDLQSTAQELTNCATGGALNDTLTVGSSAGSTDSYTRPGSTTCSTIETKVLVHMSAAPVLSTTPSRCIAASGIDVKVEAADWNIQTDGMTDDKTECENSSLTVTITDNSNGHAVGLTPSSGVVHPVWKGTYCGAAEIYASNSTGFSQNAGNYTVKVDAIRGLAQYHHGYARHTILANHDNDYTCF